MRKFILNILICAAAIGLMAGRLFAADTGELIKNGDFQKGKESWNLWGPTGTQKTVTIANDGPDGKAAATISVTAAGDESGNTHVNLSQDGIVLSKGKTYQLSFMVKGSGLPNMRVMLKFPASSAVDVAGTRHDFELKSDWQNISFNFTPTEDAPTTRIYFTNINKVGTVVSLANISLKELVKQPGK